MKKKQQAKIQMTPVSWRSMLQATPLRNVAVTVTESHAGTVCIDVPLKPQRWMVPPISWILQPSGKRTVQLDAIGTEIWQLCDGQHTVEEIIDDFAQRYALTFHEARTAVTEYIKSLIKRGVLAIRQAS